MDNGGTGTTINIYGGHLFGNVYGAGNGNYLYATDRNGDKNVTVNEYYPINPNDPDSETVPLVYTVPMRENMTQLKATSDAVKMVNINSLASADQQSEHQHPWCVYIRHGTHRRKRVWRRLASQPLLKMPPTGRRKMPTSLSATSAST